MVSVKRYFRLVFVLLLTLSLSSCFDIHEKITVNSDQSGVYRISIENSGLAGMLAMMTGGSQYESMLSELDRFVSFLGQREGITAVSSNFSPVDGDLFLQVNFKASKDFNKSLYAYFGYESLSWFKPYIKMKKKKFYRMNLSPWIAKYIERNNITIPYQEYIGDIMLHTEVLFPNKVRYATGENIQVEDNKLTQKLTLISLLHNKRSTKLKAKYKR